MLIVSRGVFRAEVYQYLDSYSFGESVRLSGFWRGVYTNCKWKDYISRCFLPVGGEAEFIPTIPMEFKQMEIVEISSDEN